DAERHSHPVRRRGHRTVDAAALGDGHPFAVTDLHTVLVGLDRDELLAQPIPVPGRLQLVHPQLREGVDGVGPADVRGVGERLPGEADRGRAVAAPAGRDRARLEHPVRADPRDVGVDHQQRLARPGPFGGHGPGARSASEQSFAARRREGEALVPEACEAEDEREGVGDYVARGDGQRRAPRAAEVRVLGAGGVEALAEGREPLAGPLLLREPPGLDRGLEAEPCVVHVAAEELLAPQRRRAPAGDPVELEDRGGVREGLRVPESPAGAEIILRGDGRRAVLVPVDAHARSSPSASCGSSPPDTVPLRHDQDRSVDRRRAIPPACLPTGAARRGRTHVARPAPPPYRVRGPRSAGGARAAPPPVPAAAPAMSAPTPPPAAPATPRRRTGLSARHLHLTALGSAIGTGLCYGSAGAIQAAGPSVLLVYLLGGAVVYFMLRALGEM